MVPRTLLIVEESPAVGTLDALLREAVPLDRILTAGDHDSALDLLRRHQPSVVTLPVSWSDDAAFVVLTRILVEAPATKVIALAPADQRLSAVRAVARGAHEVCGLPPDAEELTAVIRRAFQRTDLEREGRRLADGDAPPTLRALREGTERRAMLDALARSGGNLSATARLLGVSRPTLYALLKQHGIRME